MKNPYIRYQLQIKFFEDWSWVSVKEYSTLIEARRGEFYIKGKVKDCEIRLWNIQKRRVVKGTILDL